MNEQETVQLKPRFDDSTRWWFLPKNGFHEFFHDPVARGYEIISRHVDFPHLLTENENGEVSTTWIIGKENQPKSTWRELNRDQKNVFYFAHRENLQKMGLATIAFVAPKNATFDCRDSIESIMAGVRYGIREMVKNDPEKLQYFPPADDDRADNWSNTYATRTPPDTLSWTIAKNPNKVVVNWEGLIDWLKNRRRRDQPVPYCDEHILSALETLLTKNKAFRHHAASQRKLEQKTSKHRPKFKPEIIALACVEHNWRLAGRKKHELLPLIEDKLPVLGIKNPRWDNYRGVLKKLHGRVTFPKILRIAKMISDMP